MGLAVRSAARVEGVRAEVARCDEGAGKSRICRAVRSRMWRRYVDTYIRVHTAYVEEAKYCIYGVSSTGEKVWTPLYVPLGAEIRAAVVE